MQLSDGLNALNSPRANLHAVVGFDGFVDEIARVINKKSPQRGIEHVDRIADFGVMIQGAAGRSFGREFRISQVEGGGNAPNLADGLVAMNVQVDLYGTLGEPRHSAFDSIAERCRRCESISAAFGRTLALEFSDGKLMLNETSSLDLVDEQLMAWVTEEGSAYSESCKQADLIALCNWSKYTHMTECWRLVQQRVLAKLTHRPWALVDLADPAGREANEIVELCEILRAVGRHARLALGLNLHEAGVVARALGCAPTRGATDDADAMTELATALLSQIGTGSVIVHSQRRAAAAWSSDGKTSAGAGSIEGAFCPNPVRTTGVGDRFNAGLAVGLMSGNGILQSVALGCAAGAFFVRQGHAGSFDEVVSHARALAP